MVEVQKRWAACVHFEAGGLCAVEWSVHVATHAAASNCRILVSAGAGGADLKEPILQSNPTKH